MNLTKISRQLTKIADVVRHPDVEFYLDQVGKLLSAEGYKAGNKAVTLFNKVKETYSTKEAERLRAQLREDGYVSEDLIIKTLNEVIKNIRSVGVSTFSSAIDVRNRKTAVETIEFFKKLLPALQNASENCRKLYLDDEANHLREIKIQCDDIMKTISRLLQRGLEGKK